MKVKRFFLLNLCFLQIIFCPFMWLAFRLNKLHIIHVMYSLKKCNNDGQIYNVMS